MILEKSFQNLMPAESGDSFTALLELPLNQAVKLLHSPEMEPNSSRNDFDLVKQEPVESGFMHNSSPICSDPVTLKSTKRKDREKKVRMKSSGKKTKSCATETDGEKLPYVHVRARRGEAMDSHSLAERARREKINARMKLLQELVPGCSKIAGTSMVLDEIISHVQSLQLQVELLSMKLAAVYPTFSINLDTLFPLEGGSPVDCNFMDMVSPGRELDGQDNGNTQPIWHDNEFNTLMTPENSLLSYDYLGN